MNSSKFRFILDLHTSQSQVSIPITRGDTARVLYISLAEEGKAYTIVDGCLAKISIKRPGGTTLEFFCSIERNTTIVYDFNTDEHTRLTAQAEGIHDCQVELYDADGGVIGAPRFTMVVSERVINADDVILSEDDYTYVNAIMAKEAARQSAEEARATAETQRQDAETTRATNETERQTEESTRKTSEAGRQAAELIRSSAETGRRTSETMRGTAETNRQTAESERNTAEAAREAAEAEREKTLVEVVKDVAYLKGALQRITEVTLLASAWQGTEDPYSQVVEIEGVTEFTKVDLLPSVEQLAIFHDKDIAFVTENEDGVVTVYCIGDKPTRDYTMQVALKEVEV